MTFSQDCKEVFDTVVDEVCTTVNINSCNNITETVCQVWSLTQFYSVDFSQSRKKCVFNKHTIKVCVVDGVLRPSGVLASL